MAQQSQTPAAIKFYALQLDVDPANSSGVFENPVWEVSPSGQPGTWEPANTSLPHLKKGDRFRVFVRGVNEGATGITGASIEAVFSPAPNWPTGPRIASPFSKAGLVRSSLRDLSQLESQSGRWYTGDYPIDPVPNNIPEPRRFYFAVSAEVRFEGGEPMQFSIDPEMEVGFP
jgi:hypothetical protein